MRLARKTLGRGERIKFDSASLPLSADRVAAPSLPRMQSATRRTQGAAGGSEPRVRSGPLGPACACGVRVCHRLRGARGPEPHEAAAPGLASLASYYPSPTPELSVSSALCKRCSASV